MSARQAILSRFQGQASAGPLWLPDLVQWYNWQQRQGTLPEGMQGRSLPEVARLLAVPIWAVARPWRLETPGVEIDTEQGADARVITYRTVRGDLVERWSLGPDGDWWQAEYPVKTEADLPAAAALIEARRYVPDPARWSELDGQVGEDGVVAMELPRRPYSELLHALLGWSEGLMLLLGDGRPALLEMLEVLEAKVQGCVSAITALPGALALAPDNLDGQYVPPPVFRDHLAASYHATADALHASGKYLLVHAGGSVRRLLAPLAAAGVDGVEGVAGPPQADTPLAAARALAGPELVLWGGIPQDFLLPEHSAAEFEAAVHEAAQQAAGDGRAMLGIADRVPVGADLARLRAISELIGQG